MQLSKGIGSVQTIAAAYEWAKDKKEWENMQHQTQEQAKTRWAYQKVMKRGGPLKAWTIEEAIQRLYIAIEEEYLFKELREAWEKSRMETDRRKGRREYSQEQEVEPDAQTMEEDLEPDRKHPARNRTKTRLYQSGEEETREREHRNREKQGCTQRTQENDTQYGERESHDWTEGERMGEAKNPGPGNRY